MRRAGKKRIAAAREEYVAWRGMVDARASKLKVDGASRDAAEWADEVRRRIDAGDLGPCTQALARSVVRLIESCESGFYTRRTPTGGYECAR